MEISLNVAIEYTSNDIHLFSVYILRIYEMIYICKGLKMRNFLIKLLGGVPDSKYKDLELKIKNMQDEIELMDAYKQFAESIYFYAGNYPAWKAQSEFRQLMHSCNNPVSDEPFELSHKKYVDTYLGRIVDAFQKLILKQKQTPHFAFLDIYSWDSDYLELARGKQFLADHSKKHN